MSNGLLDRRSFLQGSLAAFGGLLVPRPAPGAGRPASMSRPGAGFTHYGQPSPYEETVLRNPVANPQAPGNGVSWTPLHRLQGTITPNGLHYERHHNGVPDIDPQHHRLLIHGLVRQPRIFSTAALLRYPMQSRICFIECGGNSNIGWNRLPAQAEAGYAHGLVSNSEWTGIPLGLLLDETEPDPEAGWLIAEGADAFAMHISIPVARARKDALLALYQNGERLRPENGYPMRLLLPGWEGVLNVKWLRRLELVRQPAMARNETARYTELLPSGKARQFTFTMQAKSLITQPSAHTLLPAHGLYQITGLAWSGQGKIRRVDVSADGGRSWLEAELQQPVLPQAFTRFRLPWLWRGQPALLQSRAVDEQGYVQPSRETLVAQRGRQGFFHYNAIVSWSVDRDGAVRHAYADHNALPAGAVDIDSGWH